MVDPLFYHACSTASETSSDVVQGPASKTVHTSGISHVSYTQALLSGTCLVRRLVSAVKSASRSSWTLC